MNSKAVFDKILSSALDGYHGMWYDRIIFKENKKRVLEGKPQFSPSFLYLYGYPDPYTAASHRPSINTMVSRDDRKKVFRGIRCVLEEGSGTVNFTIQITTKDGKEKLVEIYHRRISLDCGTEIMASLHIDLTASSDEHWLRKKLLDKMPGFVFIKQFHAISEEFRFAYVNKTLSDAFSLEDPSQAIDKCDRDFILDERQIEEFRKVDLSVMGRSQDQPPIVREEWFTVRDPKDKDKKQTLRLMTIKMPYTLPVRGPQTAPQILGVAVDVTAVTDLLRAVAEKSELGIYIKNSQHQYEIVNNTFRELMGISPDSDIIGKTFRQLIGEKKATLSDTVGLDALEKLLEEVEEEDRQVLNGGYRGHVRTAIFFDTVEWLTEKHCIKAGLDSQAHILGVASRMFGGSSMEMLDKLPQCASVKRYYPHESKERQFQVVWANKRYMERHGFRESSDYRGKSDFEISSHDPEQAERYYCKDLKVVRIGDCNRQQLLNTTVPESEKFKQLVSNLKQGDCWEYSETQRDTHGTEFMLQTTKWPEYMHGTWFVVVVYSDVTEGEKVRKTYHDMTVHTIRGMICPLDTASWLLSENSLTSNKEILYKVKECLNDSSEDIGWFLENHLMLLKMHVNAEVKHASTVAELLRNECCRVELRTRLKVGASLTIVPCEETLNSTCLKIDDNFIRAVIAELLRNAYKAVERRMFFVENLKNKTQNPERAALTGWTDFSLEWNPSLEARLEIVENCLIVTIKDNGDAAVNTDKLEELKSAFSTARSITSAREDSRLGLAFISLTMKEHNGSFTLESGVSKGATSLRIRFPTNPKQSQL